MSPSKRSSTKRGLKVSRRRCMRSPSRPTSSVARGSLALEGRLHHSRSLHKSSTYDQEQRQP